MTRDKYFHCDVSKHRYTLSLSKWEGSVYLLLKTILEKKLGQICKDYHHFRHAIIAGLDAIIVCYFTINALLDGSEC